MFCATFLSKKTNFLDFNKKIGTEPTLSWFDQSLLISCLNQNRKQLKQVLNNFGNVTKSIQKSVINLALFLSCTNRIKKYDKILNDQVA